MHRCAGGERSRRLHCTRAHVPAPRTAAYCACRAALVGCLTSTIVYKCAARGIAVDAVESRLVGDMDARRFLELTEEGRTGYRSIVATFRVKGNATADEIERLAAFSPVHDVVSRSTPVTLRVEMV